VEVVGKAELFSQSVFFWLRFAAAFALRRRVLALAGVLRCLVLIVFVGGLVGAREVVIGLGFAAAALVFYRRRF
jgi:hypothetical protein